MASIVRSRAASAARISLPRRLARLSSSTSCKPATPQNPHFPCVDAHAERESRLLSSLASTSTATSTSQNPKFSNNDEAETGPEPPYARPNPKSYKTYHHNSPLQLAYSDTPLPSFTIAYESWGILSPEKDNVILLHTGLSASSHAASTPANPAPGWWENFIGPGKALDTNQFHIICTNVIGGCYGSTGPSSVEDATGKPWATRFPIVSVFDMVNAQFRLLDSLGIGKLYASVGCSMGAMQSLAAGWLHPERVGKIVSISGTARSSPSAVAMRFAQRSVLMADPNWKNGFYYDGLPPHTGMKLARQIATITYRSGPEWDLRFGRQLRSVPVPESTSSSSSSSSSTPSSLLSSDSNPNPNPSPSRPPALCPDFLIETYLDHQGESFCLKYDANSLIYISKAMDLFDMTLPALEALNVRPSSSSSSSSSFTSTFPSSPSLSSTTPTPTAHTPTPTTDRHRTSHSKSHPPPVNPPPHLSELAAGMAPLAHIPTLVLGVQSDILFTVEQQREVADALRMAGNENVSYYELGGVWGHDTFLIDVLNVGGAIRGFLS